MNVLVVAAHPDDEVLGCGGTLARLAHEWHAITIAILGIRDLMSEVEHVSALLGATKPFMWTLLDQRFDAVDFLDIVRYIEQLIKTINPVAVYTHHTGDLNLDHAITARAVLTATRPKPDCMVKDVYMFEVPSSTEWGFNYAIKPNVFVEIDADTLKRKLNAMKLYESEMQPFPHPRCNEVIISKAQCYGSMVGVPLAEAFELVRSIR